MNLYIIILNLIIDFLKTNRIKCGKNRQKKNLDKFNLLKYLKFDLLSNAYLQKPSPYGHLRQEHQR